MLFLEIFLALWWIWLPLLVVWFILSRDKKNTVNPSGDAKDLQWQNYILSFKDIVKTKAEKNLIDAILTRKTADQLYEKTPMVSAEAPQEESVIQPTVAQTIYTKADVVVEEPKPISQPIDNTLLLLYFGAFLLTASAGLFVAIGDLDGALRTIVLAITTSFLYLAGLWLYKNKPKLTQAGVSFMGAAMIITPLIGVAWYNLIADNQNGAMIWLATSLVCVGLYIHAYSVIRNGFVAYLLIGSFVSSVESAVLAVALPSYVYAWAAIFVSLVLQALGIWRGQSKTMFQASDTSAQLLVPLSIVGSLVLLPNFGSAQLAVTLLLAGGYYALLGWQRPDRTTEYSTASQVSIIVGLANIVYSVQESISAVAVFLGIVSVLYIIGVILGNTPTIIKHELVTIGSLAISVSIALSISEPWSLVTYVTIALLLSVVVWLKLHSKTALSVGGVLLLVLPYLIGQYAMEPHANEITQMLMYAVPVVVLGAITLFTCNKPSTKQYFEILTTLYISASVLLTITAWLAGFASMLSVSILLAISYAVLQNATKLSDWWVFSSLMMLVPIAFAFLEYGSDDVIFSMMVGLGLIVNVCISLITREQAIRWIVVGCILIAPVAVGGGGLEFRWGPAGYSLGYLLSMAGCILARAIARGKLLVSSKVAVGSYDNASSQAYVAGYVSAGILAIIISLFDDNSKLVTTLVLGTLSVAVLYISYVLESNSQALILLPLLLQSILFSAIRPDLSDSESVAMTALLSASFAVLMYALVTLPKLSAENQRQVLLTIVVTSYIGSSLALLGASISEIFPLSLTIAGLLTLYHNRLSLSNDLIELSAGVILVSINWLLFVQNVRNIHVHTHLVAVFLAIFAYWRYTRNDKAGSENHVIALFLVATVPMVLQALSGTSGGTYGLILIVQQIGFMVIGIAINQRFLLRAGLWVALGSVLYQLKGLGWAFLAIVAIILIGIAMYRLQRHDDGQPKP